MKYALAASVLITLPALVALVYGLLHGNMVLVGAAAVSLALNTLPFVAAGFLIRNRDALGDDHHH